MSLGMYTKRRVEFVRMRGPNVSIRSTKDKLINFFNTQELKSDI